MAFLALGVTGVEFFLWVMIAIGALCALGILGMFIAYKTGHIDDE